jgi:hypothetical protein
MRSLNRRRWLAVGLASVLLVGLPSIVAASHSWGGYHWARTSNQFTLQLDDNVSSIWDGYLAKASSDWTKSSVLDTRVAIGTANPRKCRATLGRVVVCNAGYGNTGWLGVAQIWISGGTHITQGTVKVNDTYFNTSTYNTPAWRQMVMCQEIGHTFGLDHQDENFTNTNLGTCMDYTNDPSGTARTNGTLANTSPNQHDYDELGIIYAHLDSTTTVRAVVTSSPSLDGSDWGRQVRVSKDGRTSVFTKADDHGNAVITYVIWAD